MLISRSSFRSPTLIPHQHLSIRKSPGRGDLHLCELLCELLCNHHLAALRNRYCRMSVMAYYM